MDGLIFLMSSTFAQFSATEKRQSCKVVKDEKCIQH